MPILKPKEDPPRGPTLKVKDAPQDRSIPHPAPAGTWTAEKPASLEPPKLKPRKGQRNGSTPDALPQSIEAEMGVISSVMIDCQRGNREVISHVAAKINENFFFVPAHKTIYSMLVSLWRANRPMDLISFTEHLRTKKVLSEIGGATAVTEIQGYIDKITNYVPTAASVDYYLQLVIEKFSRREIISEATGIIRAAYGYDAEEFSDRVQRSSTRMAHIGGVVASGSNGHFPMLQDAADYYETEDPPLPDQVVYKLLHRGSKMLLGGNSKGRKTWGLIDVGVSVATGSEWWGFGTKKGAVAYINLEIQPEFFRMRYKKVCEVKDVRPEKGMFWHWPLRGHAKPMDQLIKDVMIFLKQHLFSLVIIDPIYKTLPPFRGSENDSAMITQLLNEVELITIETGAAVLFCSHFSKGNQSEKDPMDRVSGSGAWARDPDTLLTMTAHESSDCFTCDPTLRNLAPVKPFVVKWEYPLFVRDEELNPDRLKGKKGRPSDWSEEDILDQMSIVSGIMMADLQKQCEERIGMPKTSFLRYWGPLRKERKKIRQDNEGLWYLNNRSENED